MRGDDVVPIAMKRRLDWWRPPIALALDEIEPARLAFGLANEYAAAPRAPGALAELRTAPATTATSLDEFARESPFDGCLMGGAAAAAAEGCAQAREPVMRDTLEIIARDEASHADLAWEIVGWCCAEVGPALGRSLQTALRKVRSPKTHCRDDSTSSPSWRLMGGSGPERGAISSIRRRSQSPRELRLLIAERAPPLAEA